MTPHWHPQHSVGKSHLHGLGSADNVTRRTPKESLCRMQLRATQKDGTMESGGAVAGRVNEAQTVISMPSVWLPLGLATVAENNQAFKSVS